MKESLRRNVLSLAVLTVGSIAAAGYGQALQPVTAVDGKGSTVAYTPGTYSNSFSGTGMYYPTQEMLALPPAAAQLSQTAAYFRQSESNLENAIADFRISFQHSPEVRDAQAEQHAAEQAMDAARTKALAGLQHDSNYLAAASLRDRLTDQLRQEREDGTGSMPHTLALASLRMSYSATMTAMEASALAVDDDFAAARTRLVKASQRLADLRVQFADSLRSNPIVLAARRNVADSRVAMLGARALYFEAHWVAETGLGFASDTTHNGDISNINNGYGGYGGYGNAGYGFGTQVSGPINGNAFPNR